MRDWESWGIRVGMGVEAGSCGGGDICFCFTSSFGLQMCHRKRKKLTAQKSRVKNVSMMLDRPIRVLGML